MDINATSLNRVMACNGSVSMEALPASIDLPTDDAQEGIAAHFVAASVLSGRFSDPLEWVERTTPNGIVVSPEMGEHVAEFVDYLAQRAIATFDPKFQHVEFECDFAVPNSSVVVRARPDFFSWDAATSTLYIDDFKYGWRIVDPSDNWTLIGYAIAATLELRVQPKRLVVTIHQPRPYHPDGKHRSVEYTGEQITALTITLLTSLANLDNGLNTGPHCSNCRALWHCYAATQAAFNAIDASSIPYKDEIANGALSFEIDNLRRASSALTLKLEAYEALAKHRLKTNAASPGKDFAFDIEVTRGNRAFVGGITPEAIALLTGQPVDKLTTRKTITPAALERLGASEKVVAAITYRPPTGEKLVRFNASKAAQRLFGTT